MAAEDRPPITYLVHTVDLPALPQRDYLIPATHWVEAPGAIVNLGADFGVELVAYKRRIGQYLLWRAGPAAGADARYGAVLDDLSALFTFRLLADGSGSGTGADGSVHTRFRSWKQSLLGISARGDDATVGNEDRTV